MSYNLVGKQFGNIEVVEKTEERTSSGMVIWVARCKCGNMFRVRTDKLTSNKISSCSLCSSKARNSYNHIKPREFHHKSHSRLYSIWDGMRRRCLSPKSKDYKYYGLRGIQICDEWTNSFVSFESWAMSHGYNKDLTIERIDNNGNYCPENCKWVTRREQSLNTRKTIRIAILGCEKSLNGWTSFMGWKYGKYWYRHKKGHSAFSREELEEIRLKLRSEKNV